MKKAALEIGATEFKARCLQLLKEVHDRKREVVIITKRGKPVAKLTAVDNTKTSFIGCLAGKATILCDLTEPLDVEGEAMKS